MEAFDFFYTFGHGHGRYGGEIMASTIENAYAAAKDKYQDIYVDKRVTEFYVQERFKGKFPMKTIGKTRK